MPFPLSFIFLITQILENLTPRQTLKMRENGEREINKKSLRENQGEINKESLRL